MGLIQHEVLHLLRRNGGAPTPDRLAPGVPAMVPPPGFTSDFNSQSDRSDRVFIVNIICIILAAICMGLRLYARRPFTNLLGRDDYVSMASLVLIYAFSALVLDCHRLGVGQHLWNVPSKLFYEGRFFLIDTLAQFFYYFAIFFVKTSLLLLYLRVFNTSGKFNTFIYILIGFLAVYTTCGSLLNLLACGKKANAYWKVHLDTTAKCLNIWLINSVSRVFNTVTDVTIVLIPIPSVIKLHLPWRQRLGILAIFLISLLAVAASCVSLYQTVIARFVPDITWSFGDVLFWLTIELYLGFFCSCMPMFKPFFAAVKWATKAVKDIRTRASLSRKMSSGPGSGPGSTSGDSEFDKKNHIRERTSDMDPTITNQDTSSIVEKGTS